MGVSTKYKFENEGLENGGVYMQSIPKEVKSLEVKIRTKEVKLLEVKIRKIIMSVVHRTQIKLDSQPIRNLKIHFRCLSALKAENFIFFDTCQHLSFWNGS